MLLPCGAGSPLAGFVRFLHLLSQHPWKDRPLVVDPEAELTPAQHKDIDRRFDAAKAQGQLRGFTICTSTDLDGSAWGQGSVSAGMRQRLVKLAGRSLQVLQVCCMEQIFGLCVLAHTAQAGYYAYQVFELCIPAHTAQTSYFLRVIFFGMCLSRAHGLPAAIHSL